MSDRRFFAMIEMPSAPPPSGDHTPAAPLTWKYKAFISYSHAADGRLAPALHLALHRFHRPVFALRAIRVFRDKTTLAVTDALWPAIEAALSESEFFILLASPDAAASIWVQREVAWWIEHRSLKGLLLVRTNGTMSWDRTATDFDWSATSALPECLKGRYREEPFHVDLSWAQQEQQLSLRHTRFRQAVLDLAATLHHRPKDELDGEDVREYRRAQRLKRWSVGSLVALSLFASGAAYVAERRRHQVEDQLAETALARVSELARGQNWTRCKEVGSEALAAFEDLDKPELPVLAELFSAYRQEPAPLYRRPLPPWNRFVAVHLFQVDMPNTRALFLSHATDPILDELEDRPARLYDVDLVTAHIDELAAGISVELYVKMRSYIKGFDHIRGSEAATLGDGRTLSANGHRVTVHTPEASVAMEVHGTTMAALSPDGRLLATAARGTICLWDVATRRVLGRHDVDADAVDALRFSSESRHLTALAAEKRTVFLIDLVSGTTSARVLPPVDSEPAGGEYSFALSGDAGRLLTLEKPNGPTLWTVTPELLDGHILRIEATEPVPVDGPAPSDNAYDFESHVGFSRGGRHAFVWRDDGRLDVWTTAGPRHVFSEPGLTEPELNLDVGPFLRQVVLEDDGRMYLRWSDGTLQVGNMRAGRARATRLYGFREAIAPTAERTTFIHAGKNQIVLCRASDGAEIAQLQVKPYTDEPVIDAREAPARWLLRTDESVVVALLDRVAQIARWEGADRDTLDSLQRNPRDGAALVRLGRWYAARADWPWAGIAFARARENGATDIPLVESALCSWETGDAGRARAEFAAAAAGDPELAAYVACWLRAIDLHVRSPGMDLLAGTGMILKRE